ncbi:hypothetical protein U0039_10015 [Stenotrophomonas maltophilia]|uniref:hypothetical protein n=1 Tax=Stenotrophomonas maltophilia TaxID=40324 RepID=UPI0004684D50|nr:hypothetical protein [Stenotrophomonas maltophilia]OMP41131.1 hypothetical protein BMR86_03455 [Stenotrophomonas sp. KAs 5-3]AIL08734.1 hypothetical protein DP16_1951 [Stenotrophomonas maltophilia]OOD14751.1 hypothetical protein BWP19_10475 [Stenotrophomonas maltophilia]QQA84438.1 hypothetical protein I6I01_08615 [Stenotrophomonas maltophilia]WQE25658.1 hypothetical protein U0039_10015 [Stenotrophomonas maltophilia]
MKKTKAMAPRINPQRAPRERRMDHNTVSRPKRVKARPVATGSAETVEEFKARGGRVQYLTASWEQCHAG